MFTARTDSARVDHVSESVVLVTYKIAVSERCGADSAIVDTTLYSMTVWAQRSGRWQLVAQAWAPKAGGNR